MYVYTKNIISLFNMFLNEKLQKEQQLYKNFNNKREIIEKNINELLHYDSTLLSKYINNMIGGNFFTNDVTPQIEQLKNLFDEYNKLINQDKESDSVSSEPLILDQSNNINILNELEHNEQILNV